MTTERDAVTEHDIALAQRLALAALNNDRDAYQLTMAEFVFCLGMFRPRGGRAGRLAGVAAGAIAAQRPRLRRRSADVSLPGQVIFGEGQVTGRS